MNLLNKTRPAHYLNIGIEPWDVIDAWGLEYYKATALRYIARAGRKHGESETDDLLKARAFIDRRIRNLEVDGE